MRGGEECGARPGGQGNRSRSPPTLAFRHVTHRRVRAVLPLCDGETQDVVPRHREAGRRGGAVLETDRSVALSSSLSLCAVAQGTRTAAPSSSSSLSSSSSSAAQGGGGVGHHQQRRVSGAASVGRLYGSWRGGLRQDTCMERLGNTLRRVRVSLLKSHPGGWLASPGNHGLGAVAAAGRVSVVRDVQQWVGQVGW